MKSSIALMLIMTLFLSCEKSSDDFPACVGTTEAFDPQKITNPYNGKIWGEDTIIYTQFVFSDYVDYNVLLSAERSWNMWIRFIKGSSTIYQSCYCYYSYSDQVYYATTGFDYRGQYSSWDFHFESFDCSKLSGFCLVTRNEVQDTLRYYFEGKR